MRQVPSLFVCFSVVLCDSVKLAEMRTDEEFRKDEPRAFHPVRCIERKNTLYSGLSRSGLPAFIFPS